MGIWVRMQFWGKGDKKELRLAGRPKGPHPGTEAAKIPMLSGYKDLRAA
jgi:hypothetical protein